MKLGIFGGTFDPPHIGHLTALKAAVSQLGLDRVLVIPTYMPPHKDQCVNMASSEDRLEMTKLCFAEMPNVQVWDGEMNRGGKSYTIDTITELKKLYPNDELVLLMGTDMFLTLETWREYEKLMQLITCGVFIRNEGEFEAVSAHRLVLSEKYGLNTLLVRNNPVAISSTDIREMLGERLGRPLLKPSVYEYIIEHGLFEAKADFDWLRFKAYKMLKEKRIRHVAGCEAEAVSLARRWGCDADEAREAAILHDITKKEDLTEQLNICDEYGIILDEEERHEVKLLHSKTGAYIAKYRFNASDEVLGAIYWHTTGKEDMSLLEKVIYLADYIEPNRDFDGVEPLRALCYEDIDAAMEMGLAMSITDMRERGIEPHERSAKALEWFRQARS